MNKCETEQIDKESGLHDSSADVESNDLTSDKEKSRIEAIAWLEKWGAVFNQAKTQIIRVVPM